MIPAGVGGQKNQIFNPFGKKNARLLAPWRPEAALAAEQAFLTGQNPMLKKQVVRHFNAMMDNYVAALLAHGGANRANLSSLGSFPTLEEQGVPASFILDVAQREIVDTRWTILYRMLDRRSSTSGVFRVGDSYTNLEFNQYEYNESIDADYMEGDHDLYRFYIYSGMYFYNKMWESFTDMWSEGDGLGAMALRWARKMSEVAYTTVAAASGLTTVTYDATGSTQVAKDINTINAGVTTIKSQLYAATTPDGNQVKEEAEMGTYALLFNSLTTGYETRIMKALEARLDLPNDNQSVGYVMRPVVPIGSPHVPTGTWVLTMLGRHNHFAMARALMVEESLDITKAGVAKVVAGNGAYRAVRHDPAQVVLLALS